MEGNRGTYRRAIDVLKREGVSEIMSRALARLIDVRTHVLLECDLTQAHPKVVLPEVRFTWVSLQDLDGHPELGLTDAADTRAASAARLGRGDRCLVGYWSGAPATYLWVTTAIRELPRLALPVRPEAAFVYKTFTLASYRGRGLNRGALAFAFDDYRARGARQVFVDVDVTNGSSLRALRGAGFRDVAQYRTVKIGPLTTTLMGEAAYRRVAGRTHRSAELPSVKNRR